jgi:UDP-2,3-diacylglucosamine pyrophosphatase LpxH
MIEPVRILSDLHLGHKVSRIERVATLRPLIAGAGTVVFNGDTWQELAQPFRDRSAAMLAELQTICAEEGAATVFLSGNHDPGWPGPGWLELAGGRILITHGDALLYDGSPWKREILTNSEHVRLLWQQHPAASHNAEERLRLARAIARTLRSVEFTSGRHALLRAWDALLPPHRALKILQAWFTQAASGGRFCDCYFPRAEALIIGHFHHSGCWEKNRRLVINTGSFTNPGRAHWVQWHHGSLTRGQIDESQHACRLGKILGTWRFD